MKYCQCSNIHTYVKNYTSTHMGLINIISPEKLGDKKVREIELRTSFFFIVFNFTKVFASACKLFNWIACCVGIFRQIRKLIS